MYVGDNPRNDVDPPKRIGMVTVLSRACSRQPLGEEEPDHVIESFEELRGILRERYGVGVGAG